MSPRVTDEALRVAYTLEHCWHRVPGGTAVAANRIATELARRDDVRVLGVAGRHRRPPVGLALPPIPLRRLPVGWPLLYESWLRWRRPAVERATGPVDVAHATALIPCPSAAPLVVTVHDVLFLDDPERARGWGAALMRRAWDVTRRRAAIVITSSEASRRELVARGLAGERIRVVPLGVEGRSASAEERDRVRRRYALPERFVLFVGTLEPRKNLGRLVRAVVGAPEHWPLVVVGPAGWGSAPPVEPGADVRFLGFVPDDDLPAIYAEATVFAYPSEQEGFGLPVIEAMAQGTPVVTSAGRSTEEVAGGAAVLVDPFDVDDIRAGIVLAAARAGELAAAGAARAASMTWSAAADATVAVYREVAGA